MALEGKLIEIRELWAEGFPQRHENVRAFGLRQTLREVIEQRAAEYAQQADDIVEALHHELDSIGIPRGEFYE